MNKKISLIVGSLAVAGVVGFGVYQSSADSNVLFQSTESTETEELEMKEREETEATKEGVSVLTREEVRAQLTAEYPGIVTTFELDREDGTWMYEVDIYGPEAEYELDVDAETGEVVKVEQEIDNGKKYEVLSEANLIPMDEAENIALNEFAGTIKEVELDRDDGRIIYEIEIKDGEAEAEFDIDATTGEIIKFESDDEV